jgi:diadenylate cyclase
MKFVPLQVGLYLFKIGFLPIQIWDVLDILIVGVLIFQLYKLLRGTIAYTIFAGLLVLYGVWWLVDRLQMDLLSAILDQFVNVGVIILVIIFQQEIRRILLFLGNTAFKRQVRILGTLLDANLPKEKKREKQIAAVAEAILRMSRKKTGAIIICAGKVKLEGLVSNGTNLDAEVNGLLIESIFQKESPLHDGALILSEGRIASAGCILPLTEKTDLPKSAGLRHRAAVGITERAEVAAFVVSEESGYVSFSREGNLRRKLDEETLQKLLQQFYS